jgi:hypothetical protein
VYIIAFSQHLSIKSSKETACISCSYLTVDNIYRKQKKTAEDGEHESRQITSLQLHRDQNTTHLGLDSHHTAGTILVFCVNPT